MIDHGFIYVACMDGVIRQLNTFGNDFVDEVVVEGHALFVDSST